MNKCLVEHIDPHRQHLVSFTMGLRKHCNNLIVFTLFGDKFGVEYKKTVLIANEHILISLLRITLCIFICL